MAFLATDRHEIIASNAWLDDWDESHQNKTSSRSEIPGGSHFLWPSFFKTSFSCGTCFLGPHFFPKYPPSSSALSNFLVWIEGGKGGGLGFQREQSPGSRVCSITSVPRESGQSAPTDHSHCTIKMWLNVKLTVSSWLTQKSEKISRMKTELYKCGNFHAKIHNFE